MGAYTLLQDLTVATNSTSVVLDDFGTITKDDFMKVVFTRVRAAGPYVFIYPNTTAGVSGHNTASNYHTQELNASGTSVVAVRSNASHFTEETSSGNGTATTIAYLKISENGKFNFFKNSNFHNETGVAVYLGYGTSSNLTFNDPITSLTFTAGSTDGIGTGSRIQIYKLAAQKVADFTVATNSTQVNIPFPTGTFDPAIDKDSEYLLVSDFAGPSGGGTGVALYINDNTTASNYYFQLIEGINTSANAARANAALYTFLNNGNTSLTYTHIKLSNIGAYTFQSYQMRDNGGSAVHINNWFGSSTAENITSITKLNIISTSAANRIAAGTRFTLYKLYE